MAVSFTFLKTNAIRGSEIYKGKMFNNSDTLWLVTGPSGQEVISLSKEEFCCRRRIA